MTDPQPSRIVAQYRTTANLQARITLHERFSVNPYGWQRWVFDQFDLPEAACVLELGCGPGNLWVDNLERISRRWKITLSDFSEGMLEQAQSRLSGLLNFRFVKIEAGVEPLPFVSESLNAVIANHMLFHVKDKPALFVEIQRVLKPGGRVFATTVGQNHLVEVHELVQRFDPNRPKRESMTDSFTLENGAAQLEEWFEQVELRRYPDALHVNDAALLSDFILSLWDDLSEDQQSALRAYVAQELAARGGEIHIAKDSGIFTAKHST